MAIRGSVGDSADISSLNKVGDKLTLQKNFSIYYRHLRRRRISANVVFLIGLPTIINLQKKVSYA